MTRGFKSPADQAPLPKVSFVLVQDDDSAQLAGVHDQQARSYGCAFFDACFVGSVVDASDETMTFPSFKDQTITFGI